MRNKLPVYGTSEWKLYQYKRALEERRGRNYKYATGNEFEELESKGYQRWEGKVVFPSAGKEIVDRLRLEGNYARMLLVSNNIRGCSDVYIYYT